MNKPPSELYLGMVSGEWPVVTFVKEAHAISWMQGDRRRRIWKAKVNLGPEQVLVEKRSYLVSIEVDAADMVE